MKTSHFTKLFALFMALCLTLALVACKTSVSATYAVDTGDKLKVSLDTQTGFRLDSGDSYTISRDGVEYLEGTFGIADTYKIYAAYIDEDDTVELLEEAEKDGNPYLFYHVPASEMGGDEYDYIVRIADSEACAVLCGVYSEDGAREAFDALSFEAVP